MVVLKIVLYFGNGKREYLQGAFPLKICKELVGPSCIYFHVITCLTCLPLIADSCLLRSWSGFLCAYVMCSVKFSYVFHLNFFKSLTCPRLGISLVACLSQGTDGVWTLLFQEGVYLRVVFCCSLIVGMFLIGSEKSQVLSSYPHRHVTWHGFALFIYIFFICACRIACILHMSILRVLTCLEV